MKFRFGFVLAVTLAAPAAVRAAPALPVLDAARIAALESAAAEWNFYRVTTHKVRYSLRNFDADHYGIVVRAGQERGAIISIANAESPRRVSWADIETVEGRRNRFSKGHVLAGGLIGGTVGLALGLTTAWLVQKEIDVNGWIIFTPAVAGTLTGAVIGGAIPSGSKWSRIYP